MDADWIVKEANERGATIVIVQRANYKDTSFAAMTNIYAAVIKSR